MLFEEFALREGSGGAGEHRGGFGVNYAIELRRGEARASMVMDHGRTGPQGVLGGARRRRSTPCAIEPAAARPTGRRICPRTRTSSSAGRRGAGVDAGRRRLRRSAAPRSGKVARDVARGYYTREQAGALFGVALDADGAVDARAHRSAALRTPQPGRLSPDHESDHEPHPPPQPAGPPAARRVGARARHHRRRGPDLPRRLRRRRRLLPRPRASRSDRGHQGAARPRRLRAHRLLQHRGRRGARRPARVGRARRHRPRVLRLRRIGSRSRPP